MSVDYVAACSFMWNNNKCVPFKIAFVSVHDPSVVYTVEPDKNTCFFSMEDVMLNMALPANPFDATTQDNDQVTQAFVVPLWDMDRFLCQEFHPKYLEHYDIWGKGIVGCEDMATFNYLFGVLPLDTVRFLEGETSAIKEATSLAQDLKNARDLSNDPCWDATEE